MAAAISATARAPWPRCRPPDHHGSEHRLLEEQNRRSDIWFETRRRERPQRVQKIASHQGATTSPTVRSVGEPEVIGADRTGQPCRVHEQSESVAGPDLCRDHSGAGEGQPDERPT